MELNSLMRDTLCRDWLHHKSTRNLVREHSRSEHRNDALDSRLPLWGENTAVSDAERSAHTAAKAPSPGSVKSQYAGRYNHESLFARESARQSA